MRAGGTDTQTIRGSYPCDTQFDSVAPHPIGLEVGSCIKEKLRGSWRNLRSGERPVHFDPLSFNGRTTGSEPVDWGSIPCEGAMG